LKATITAPSLSEGIERWTLRRGIIAYVESISWSETKSRRQEHLTHAHDDRGTATPPPDNAVHLVDDGDFIRRKRFTRAVPVSPGI